MSWKKSLLFFAWQSVRYARNWAHFRQIWSYRNRWRESFAAHRNSVADELPWLNFPAIDYLKKIIRPENKVFEFGGGGSTLFFCKNVAEVATVEDHSGWFDTLNQTVHAKGYKNWKGFFVAPEPFREEKTRSKQNPGDFASGAKGMENMSFEKYARTIDQFPPAYFDLILVDGRARPSCIQQAMPHLKTGGFLIIDNTERSYYLAHFQKIISENYSIESDGRAPVAYTPDFTQTTILRKIK
ncbi:MAG: hypothetical protein DYG98_27260 [Haliscomenobacteraceae bacterium CHB4]|nr:hypothetical protein [Haliscomenobacteraceae bacterium CHB4]